MWRSRINPLVWLAHRDSRQHNPRRRSSERARTEVAVKLRVWRFEVRGGKDVNPGYWELSQGLPESL